VKGRQHPVDLLGGQVHNGKGLRGRHWSGITINRKALDFHVIVVATVSGLG